MGEIEICRGLIRKMSHVYYNGTREPHTAMKRSNIYRKELEDSS